MGYEKFPGILSTFSLDFPVKDSWEFPRIPRKDSRKFPRIFRKIVTWVMSNNKNNGSYEAKSKLKFCLYISKPPLKGAYTNVEKGIFPIL